MEIRVAHFIEKYALSGESYAYDQVALTKSFRGQIFADQKVKNNYQPLGDVKCFRQSSTNSTLNRVADAFRRRIISNFYDKRMNDYFAKVIPSDTKLLHAHFGMMGSRICDLRSRLNLPLIVSFYGVDVSQVIRDSYWLPKYHRMFKAADRFIVLAEEVVERLAKLGCPREKISIWDIGIPIDEYPYISRRQTDNVSFLCVARFVEKKGHSVLLEAFSKVLPTMPHATLTLMGHGPLQNEIEQQIISLRLQNRVNLVNTFTSSDFFSDFKLALAGHDIFVLPSVVAKNGDDEGGPPVVITNAMASGMPVVSTPIGGITRAIDDGQDGILVKPNDPNSLASAMTTLINQPDLRMRLGLAAHDKVKLRFCRTKQIEKLEEIYRDTIEQSQ